MFFSPPAPHSNVASPFEEHIQNLQAESSKMAQELKKLSQNNTVYQPPERKTYLKNLTIAIESHTLRIQALGLMQKNEPITAQAHALLMLMDVFKTNPIIATYPHISKEIQECTAKPCRE